MTLTDLQFDPLYASLTAKQQEFIQKVAEGMSPLDAVKATFNYNNPANQRRQKSRLLKKAAIRELLKKLGQPDQDIQDLTRQIAQAPSIRKLDAAQRALRAVVKAKSGVTAEDAEEAEIQRLVAQYEANGSNSCFQCGKAIHPNPKNFYCSKDCHDAADKRLVAAAEARRLEEAARYGRTKHNCSTCGYTSWLNAKEVFSCFCPRQLPNVSPAALEVLQKLSGSR